ncbi:Putative phosphoribosyltransferase-like [Pacmanvirus A23]|uniref:Putative phosphoribosyltransferase-like n=1 Tax=Pacmanvirus A23 TaxID=1932881 RepID=UPI000A094E8B|nr:Putative phosphoribosyltransferase-like [Pacmanvirus A23]SIP85842.1 Putative phosphoribosyltransferase-like [Pacmanvirus A23]
MNNINLDKLQKYKDTLSQKNKEIVDTIVHNTIYIETDVLIEMVKQSLIKFISQQPKYNLYIPTNKIGSEHLLMLKLQEFLKPVCCITDKLSKNTKIPNDYPILIIDDAIYSSHNMCAHVDNLTYHGIKNKIYCVVGVLSSRYTQVVRDFGTRVITYCVLEDKMICNLFKDYDFEYFYANFGCETQYILPLFFEHKIANEFGSYNFYHEICEKPINRAPIESITQQQVDDFIKNTGCIVIGQATYKP